MNSSSEAWSPARPPCHLVIWHTEGTAISGLLSWMWRLKSSLPASGIRLTLASLELQPFRFAQVCAPGKIYDVRVRTAQEFLAFLKTHASAVHLINHAYEYIDLIEKVQPAWFSRLTLAGICHTDQDYYYHNLRRLDSRLSGMCAVSPKCVEKLEQMLPHRRGMIPVLPDWDMPLPDAPRALDPDETRPLRVLFNGRILHLQKRVLDLPEISRRLAEAGARVELTIVGDGPDLPLLRDEFKQGSHVPHRFLEPRAPWEMEPLLAQHDVFLQLSEFEGASVSLMEAMVAGLAPVVTKTESGTELLKDGVNARMLPVGDVDAIALSLGELAFERRLVGRLGRNAYETARAGLAQLDYAGKMRDFIEEMHALTEIQSLKLAL